MRPIFEFFLTILLLVFAIFLIKSLVSSSYTTNLQKIDHHLTLLELDMHLDAIAKLDISSREGDTCATRNIHFEKKVRTCI
jgi:hypothetical protein